MGEAMPSENSKKRSNKLTYVFTKSIGEPGKYHDGGGLGLYLRVDQGGSKFWVQRITVNGKRRELGLGSPPVITLANVRETALENKRMVRAGKDPLQAKRLARGIPTFEEATHKVYELNKPTWNNAKHAAQFISTLQTYAFPKIGQLKISDIATSDVMAVLTPFWTVKPETARRVRQRIGTVMKWAVAQGYRDYDPAQNVIEALPKQNKVQNHRKALHYSEVAGCVDAIKRSKAGDATKLALELLILTASRSGEIRNACWDEFSLDISPSSPFPVWSVPASRMKAKRTHTIPLSTRVFELLGEAEALSDGSGLVFPGTSQGKALSDMTLSKLVKELGFDADVHGFRTSFKTWAQEKTDFANEVSEMALAHTIKNKAEAAYARSDLIEKRKQMMEQWAEYLAR
jgi:integrase